MADPFLKDNYRTFVHRSRYSRWLPDKGRRETWEETVDRYVAWLTRDLDMSPMLVELLREPILACEVMPSMRAMMTAGPAADRNNTAIYNCSYLPIDDPIAFSEVLLILMHGTGVGFSVESRYVGQLPEVPVRLGADEPAGTFVVEDSKEGWADAVQRLFNMAFNYGLTLEFDLGNIRPKGAPLKTFGGRASGPEPLREMIEEIYAILLRRAGQRLRPVDVYDIVCCIAASVVVGGVRRSALMCLSDLDDTDMRYVKNDGPSYRRLANISAVYDQRPDEETFDAEWTALVESMRGERGIFNRAACDRVSASIGRSTDDWGTNPCSEIILRPFQFCNLTEVVARNGDTDLDLSYKVSIAALLGTLQARKTHFPGLRPIWKETTERDALLGVSITGQSDLGRDLDADLLENLRSLARDVNRAWSDKLGVNPAAAVTCVKPSGTVSQLVDAASGMHPRYAKKYIRRVRADATDPLAKFLEDQGVPCEPCVYEGDRTKVFSFPIRAPEHCVTRHDVSAIDQLDHWLRLQRHWCDHKPSLTCYVRDDEWSEVRDWVWEHFDEVAGIAFLPYDGGVYPQLPYEEVDEDVLAELEAAMPELDWDAFEAYENRDNTIASQELACSGGVCEVVDLKE